MQFPRLIVSLALAGTLATGAAFAQSAAPAASGDASKEAPDFASLSKDGKGLTRGDLPKDVDALKQLRAHFGEADRDHNGRLDASEYNTYLHKGEMPGQN